MATGNLIRMTFEGRMGPRQREILKRFTVTPNWPQEVTLRVPDGKSREAAFKIDLRGTPGRLPDNATVTLVGWPLSTPYELDFKEGSHAKFRVGRRHFDLAAIDDVVASVRLHWKGKYCRSYLYLPLGPGYWQKQDEFFELADLSYNLTLISREAGLPPKEGTFAISNEEWPLIQDPKRPNYLISEGHPELAIQIWPRTKRGRAAMIEAGMRPRK